MGSFKDKTIKIIQVEPRPGQSTIAKECFKALGFENFERVSTVKEGLSLLEDFDGQPVWVLTLLLPEDECNGFHFLKAFLANTELHECRVSFLLDKEEVNCLPTAFSMGLMSCHTKEYNKNNFTNEIESLLSVVAADPTTGCWTAAKYLRDYLTEIENFPSLVTFEESLIRVFPQNPEFFVCLAEAYGFNNQKDKAKKTLYQAKAFGGSYDQKASQLLSAIPVEAGDKNLSGLTIAQTFDLKSCVIIESDDASLKMIQDVIKGMAFPSVQSFVDGQAAWDWMNKNPEPDLIIQEWKIPKLSGPALIQRYSQKGFYKAAILVVSSLVKKEDTMLFKEMGVDLSLDKPTGSAALTTAVMSLIQQKIVPGSYKALETKIRKALKGKDVKLAQELMVQIEAMPDVPQSCIKSLQAEFFFFEGKAHEAQTLCYQAMMEGGDSLINLNLLGKIMLKLGAFEESIKLFNKAQQFNPLNFERLCLLAEAQNEVGNKESAKEHIEQAETMDANNQRIISTKANMAMANKDDAEASDLLTQLDSLGDILSFSNNRAISLAKSGELTKSRELYERVLRNLPANKHDIKSTLYYNIALNYIRSGDLKKADEYISRALLNGHKESVKLMDLQRKIQKSIKSGHKLSFQNKPPGKVELSTMVLDLNPGDLCCYRIFSQPANLDEKVSALINKPLKFKFAEKKTNP